ncbi:PREDICTED: persulfide dioxygenase ETHE1, mitochondrial [Pseudopodoces humilis]|uniref:persulfide dioxygenase ETHE1, mitochondrial n=1 Tax=Pseudopodoces humilis TaxID=181119 RepID=UPI0006B6B12C|nr:PREDICTED: persulfide dioxygenase ETHE1, mitochondrial [Pseudopodoces humilis]
MLLRRLSAAAIATIATVATPRGLATAGGEGRQLLMRQLFEASSCTYTYLLADARSGDAVIIDPVLETVPRDLRLLRELGLTLHYAGAAPPTADTPLLTPPTRSFHPLPLASTALLRRWPFKGSPFWFLRSQFGFWGPLTVFWGPQALRVVPTPGHTPGCVTFVLDDSSMAFTGDALLIRGCGRTDFQQGCARTLHRSVHERIFTLPESCRVYPGHDYADIAIPANLRCGIQDDP